MKFIVLCNNQSFGESLALSLHTIYGFETHILHRGNRRLFIELRDIGIEGGIVLLEDNMIGINYPALIDDISKHEPALQILVGDTLSSSIPTSTIKRLGCDLIIRDDVGLRGVINGIHSWYSGDTKLDQQTTPLDRQDADDRIFLQDVYRLAAKDLKDKYKVSQQRVHYRKSELFKKMHLNPVAMGPAFRALCHLYQI